MNKLKNNACNTLPSAALAPQEDEEMMKAPSSPTTSSAGRALSLAIIGGGAAGFFLAINAKEMMPELDVTIYEQQSRPLKKVEISGGGRCNCTNSFAEVSDLRQVYPRGASLLKRLFKVFGPKDACRWFEVHGVQLVVQDDQCVFPKAQDSHAIIDCFMNEARKHGVKLVTGTKVDGIEPLFQSHDYVAVTTGGISSSFAHSGFFMPVDDITPLSPSLFTFTIHDEALTNMMGVVVENAIASIPGTKHHSQGPLLITHWGLSGPAVLKLSSHAAIHLAEADYKSPLLVNWVGEANAEHVRKEVEVMLLANGAKLVDNIRMFNLQSRLWHYLLDKAKLQNKRCSELGKKGVNRLVNVLTNDAYAIVGRSHYKEEFVTCGGISLDSIDKRTLESKSRPGLFYAGEVLDIDGVTGGFNFQAAWTTAYVVAQAIKNKGGCADMPEL